MDSEREISPDFMTCSVPTRALLLKGIILGPKEYQPRFFQVVDNSGAAFKSYLTGQALCLMSVISACMSMRPP